MGDLDLTLPPGQWRPGPPLDSQEVHPDEQAELDVQLVRRTLRVVLDKRDRPTGWVAAQGWWHRAGALAPDLIQLLVRAEVLPDGILPELPGGGDR